MCELTIIPALLSDPITLRVFTLTQSCARVENHFVRRRLVIEQVDKANLWRLEPSGHKG